MPTKNLGIVRAVEYGTDEPVNLKMLWYDEGDDDILKFYNKANSSWEPLIQSDDSLVSTVNGISANETTKDLVLVQDDIPDGELYAQYSKEDKTKLASLESSKFKGTYISEAALNLAYPTSVDGAYAYVDEGEAYPTYNYIWDDTDLEWQNKGESSVDSPSVIKEKYESNDDTNPLTDTLLEKLNNIEEEANKYEAPTGTVVDEDYSHIDNNYTDEEKAKLEGIEELAEVNNITDTNATALTNKGDTTLHYHQADIDVAKDYADKQIDENEDIIANTAARHTHDNKTTLDATTAPFTVYEETKLSGVEENAEVNDSSLYSVATLTNAVTQTLDTSINKNAICDVQLLGDLTLTLTNLSAISVGVINIAAQTTERTISIIAAGINVKADVDIEMITSVDGKVSFTYLYDGVDLLINKGLTYVEMA